MGTLQVALLLFAYSLVTCATSFKCHSNIQQYYTELGCKPVYTSNPDCPSSYDCGLRATTINHDKCYFNGIAYDEGTYVTAENATLPHDSMTGCKCVHEADSVNVKWTCSDPMHCLKPDMLTREPYDQVKCSAYRFKFDLGCKNSFTFCEDKEILKENIKCEYNGTQYSEGNSIFPYEDFSCMECICAPGFNGSLVAPYCHEPFSQRFTQFIKTNEDFVSVLNAPIFDTEHGCKAIEFRSPKENDTIVEAKVKSSNENHCIFGKNTLHVDDRLNSVAVGLQTAECKCEIPPVVTCQFTESARSYTTAFQSIQTLFKSWKKASNRL